MEIYYQASTSNVVVKIKSPEMSPKKALKCNEIPGNIYLLTSDDEDEDSVCSLTEINSNNSRTEIPIKATTTVRIIIDIPNPTCEV